MFTVLAPLLLALGAPIAGQCATIPGWERVLANEQVRWIIIGEAHGTNEIPRIFLDAVCLTAQSRRVVVAVEQPSSDQSAIDAFISSDGGSQAEEAFLRAQMWNQPTKDGRSSQAYFRLFEALRIMRATGEIAGVVAIQPFRTFPGSLTVAEVQKLVAEYSQAQYEKDMAKLVERAAQPGTIVLALTGGIHAMLTEVPFGDKFIGMAGHLPPESTLTFNAVSQGGESWACQAGSCGPIRFSDASKGQPRSLVMSAENPTYSGTLYLGSPITVSAPQPPTL
jgi:hypothetical protein